MGDVLRRLLKVSQLTTVQQTLFLRHLNPGEISLPHHIDAGVSMKNGQKNEKWKKVVLKSHKKFNTHKARRNTRQTLN